MKMVSHIAFENIRYYKSRNILIGIAIFLTTLLLYLVPSTGLNLIEGQFAVVNEIYPTWHALFRDVEENEVEKLAAYHDISTYGLRCDAGRIASEEADIFMIYLDENGFLLYKTKLLEGELPQKEDEIVVSANLLKAIGKADKSIGDRITLSYQILQADTLGFMEEKEFLITGFVEDQASGEQSKVYSAFVSKAFLEQEIPSNIRTYRFLFQVNSRKDALTSELENKINSIADVFGIPDNNILINDDYLMANYVDPAIQPAIIGIMAIVMAAGIITIYSVYYIGMTDRIQEFGRIKAIGATRKQIRWIVLLEGLLVAFAAIPIGLIAGSVRLKGVFYLFLHFFQGENQSIHIMKELFDNNQLSLFHGWIYAAATLVALLTVCVSLLRPMLIMSRISVIEAIRFRPECTDRKGKRVRKEKSFLEITLPRLSYIYLTGNKKNTGITILSMGITGVFLMVTATILSCANPKEIANGEMLGQYEVVIKVDNRNKEHPERKWNNIIRNNPLNCELKKKIEELEGVTFVSEFDYIRVFSDSFGEDSEGVGGVPEEYASQLEDGIIEGTATYEDLKSGDNVIIDKDLLQWYPDLKIGDTLVLNVDLEDEECFREVTILAIGDYSTGFTNYNDLLMAKEGARKLCSYNITESYHIFTSKVYSSDMEQALHELIAADSDRLQIQTWQEVYEEWSSSMATISGACYMFFGILGAICVMNIINTMIHSVHVRKKEIGMMQALGMTDRQLIGMLQQEGFLYILGTLILSIGVGSALGYPVFLWAKEKGMFGISNYHYPAAAAGIISLSLLLIQIILVFSLSRAVKKKTLVERIRFSE